MSRARSDVREITQRIQTDLRVVGAEIGSTAPAVEEAWIGIEMFCAVALRIFAKVDPGELRREAAGVHLQRRGNLSD